MLNSGECKYHGFHACLALWKKRPQDVVKVFVDKDNLDSFKQLLKWCSQNKRGYNLVSKKDLESLTESVHHEGICMIAKELKTASLADLYKEVRSMSKGVLIPFLCGVQNPHNIGAILRTAAHYDVPYLLSSSKDAGKLSASTYRVAQGGAEWTRNIPIKEELATLKQLKKEGFTLIGTSSHKGKDLYKYAFPKKGVLLMGGESYGIDSKLENLIDDFIQIPGTGHVESLNVSVATAVIMSTHYNKQRLERG